jgi:hypothetical protein
MIEPRPCVEIVGGNTFNGEGRPFFDGVSSFACTKSPWCPGSPSLTRLSHWDNT